MTAVTTMIGMITVTSGAMGAVRAMRAMGSMGAVRTMGSKYFSSQQTTQNNNHSAEHQKSIAGNIAFFVFNQILDAFGELWK